LNKSIVIAIDGTSASGKSTNARLIARKLGYVYVDTGAMYRTLAWHCLRSRIDLDDARAVAAALRRWKAKLVCVEGELRQARLLVDSYYPEKEIRTAETSAATPHVAAQPKVRDWMKKKQRECLKFGSLVMEGRDIGSNVFPETDFKFYLDASLDERVQRRAEQLMAKGLWVNSEELAKQITERDRRDRIRPVGPLRIAPGATVIDTTSLSFETVVQTLLAQVQAELSLPAAV